MFLTFVISSALNAWLLAVVAMSCFSTARGDELNFKGLSVRALKGLPKVLLSYVGLISLVVLSAFIRPLLLVIVLFVWAPLFCVGELFVDEPEEDGDEVGDEFEDFGGFQEKLKIQERPSLFRRKLIFELGFGRAMHLGIRNVSSTLQIGLLIWCANVVPAAIVGMLTPAQAGFGGELAKIILSAVD